MKYLMLLLTLASWIMHGNEEDPCMQLREEAQETGDFERLLEKEFERHEQMCKESHEAIEFAAEQAAENEKLRAVVLADEDELERVGRAKHLLRLERALLSRYMDPFDRWLQNPYVTKEQFPRKASDVRWYALIIEPPDRTRNDAVWVKFCIDPGIFRSSFNYDQCDHETQDSALGHYLKTVKRAGLAASLEQLLLLAMANAETVDTVALGTAHFYRLATEDSDPDKVRKEDRIY